MPRRALAALLVTLFSVVIVATTIGTWTRTTLLHTDRFVDAVGPLPEDPEVDRALAIFLADEIFTVLDVQRRTENVLPTDLDFLAVPLADSLRELAEDRVEAFLETPTFDRVWRDAVRIAHENALAVLRDDASAVVTEDGEVVLDLVPVANEVLEKLAGELPELFGRQISFPEITDATARELRSALEDALGVELAEDFARIPVFHEDKLSEAQDAVHLVNRLVTVLVLGAIATGAGAVALSVDRRRTLVQLALGAALAISFVFVVLRRVVADLLDLVSEGPNRDAAAAATEIVSRGLRHRAWYVLAVGLAVAAVTYLAGPGRGAARLRRGLASLGERSTRSHGDAWRVGGVAVAMGVLLAADLSWLGLLVVLGLLVAYQAAVTAAVRR